MQEDSDMKQNGYNLKSGDYYLGLDIGSNSVGWAVTDLNYRVLKFKGNAMWGIRLFDEAADASERRSNRTARRRLERRKQRLLWLEMLFSDEIRKVDPYFFLRLKESSLHLDDKSNETGKYALFNDPDFNDKDYLKKYPTIYHLRRDLIKSTEPHDIRLVYLAIHHIMKNRGHFLFSGDAENAGTDLTAAIDQLCFLVADNFDTELTFTDRSAFESALLDASLAVSAKKAALKKYVSEGGEELDVTKLAELLSGATVRFADLFCDESLKDAEKKSVTLKSDIDADFDALSDALGDRVDLILEAKKVFDCARLSQILNNRTYISEAKIDLYEKNKADLKLIKKYIKDYAPQAYRHIFTEKKEKLNNYAAYCGYKTVSGDYSCKQEDFCKFLSSEIKELPETEETNKIRKEITEGTFLTKLTGTDNGVIPNQLHKVELKAILANAGAYLPFLRERDAEGKSVSDKIVGIFEFRIPYFVGPLNRSSERAWVVRTDEKIYPWTFEKVVDLEKSSGAFMNNLIGRCSYTGDYVLPLDSLLYSEYMVLNEINPLKINGKPISVELKKEIYHDLFEESLRKVTKRTIKDYLLARGLAQKEDEINGVDDVLKARLKSYHDFKRILEKTGDRQMVEEIIRSILVFGDDKKMLRRWLEKNTRGLSEADFNYISRLTYKDWGRLSAELLTGIYHTDKKTGEAFSIMDMLRNTNCNLMQLLSSDYTFSTKAAEAKSLRIGTDRSLDDKLSEMYIAPAVRRSIRQALRITDELVDIMKSSPRKIFIEVARGGDESQKNRRTVSRKDRLIDLYKACGKEGDELFERLKGEPEDSLRRDKLYLYYTQFGKCMYSGEPIDISALAEDNTHYDIDHIFPRSRIKDDSINNRVLVKSELNREKTNTYPINIDTQKKMHAFWKLLKDKGFISDKKYERLVRVTPLTDDELASFVARQLVETQQSTKAVVTLLKELYPETRFVYSKAGNVSDFRQQFDLIKCRDVNDLHHAKDAYLNIVVGNVYDTKFTEKFFANIHRETYSLNKVFEYNVPAAWDKDLTPGLVKAQMAKNNIRYTRMPYIRSGQLYEITILPAGKGQLPIKHGADISKYGGYGNLTVASFFAVEHTVKKKRVRTIEVVPLYQSEVFHHNPLQYCSESLGLVDPFIISSAIYIDSLIEIDSARLHITSRNDERCVAKHAYQFTPDHEHETYVKEIAKYIDRCKAQRSELTVTAFDHITAEKNLKLYNYLLVRLATPVYAKWFKNIEIYLESTRSKFTSLSLFAQCQQLLEILKCFKCDSSLTSLKALNGNGAVGKIRFNKNISNCKSAGIIHQSVTGLYEYREDLLR